MFEKVPPSVSGLLRVDDQHEIYWEQSGNPDGFPALYLHGGPGGTLGAGGYRARFDPSRFRLVGLDQRGCGRSVPRVTAPGYDLSRNTTGHLIEDIEKLRDHLGIDRWLVNGSSWGSTLAVAYAQAHPSRVSGVVLVAVTMAGHAERAGIGFRRGQGRLIEAYARLMRHPDPAVRDETSRAWADWESHHVAIGAGGFRRDPRWDDDEWRHVFATLVTHYWAADGFLTPPILERMDRLRGIPATLIHGRLDVSGPAEMAWRLHRAWPGSELVIVEDEGHGGTSMAQACCSANSRHADRLEAYGRRNYRRSSRRSSV